MESPRTGILADYLAEKELARELGHNPATLARWRKRKIGPPHIEAGREIFYHIEQARAWLAAGGTAAAKLGRKRR